MASQLAQHLIHFVLRVGRSAAVARRRREFRTGRSWTGDDKEELGSQSPKKEPKPNKEQSRNKTKEEKIPIKQARVGHSEPHPFGPEWT